MKNISFFQKKEALLTRVMKSNAGQGRAYIYIYERNLHKKRKKRRSDYKILSCTISEESLT